eukprot:COSAG02_NODE_9840_length_2095_cov_10.704409_2_plen_39_part_01
MVPLTVPGFSNRCESPDDEWESTLPPQPEALLRRPSQDP